MERRNSGGLEAAGIMFPYRDFGRDTRFEEAAARWPLIRSTDRFLIVERDRRRAERERAAEGPAGNVAHLDTRRVARPTGPPATWYLNEEPQVAGRSGE